MSDLRVSDKAVVFDEFKVSDHVHPLAPPAPDFDWEALAVALGEEIPDADQQRLAHALGCLVSFAATPFADCLTAGKRLSPRRAERSVARMVLVIAWLLRPEEFGGLPLEVLARRLGCNERHLRRLLANVRERFGTIRQLQ
jgi:hypothetical protein